MQTPFRSLRRVAAIGTAILIGAVPARLVALGVGLELLLSTDIRAAVPEARFGLPEVGDLSVRRPGTAPIRSRIAAHCAYGDCLRPKLRWRGWRRGVLPRALWPSASSAPR